MVFKFHAISHIGILFRDENNDIYILDSDIGQNMKEGCVMVQLLKDKLKKYKGDNILGFRSINKKIEYPKIKEIFNQDKDLDFDCWMLDWILSPLGIGNYFKDNNKVFCSEYIHSVLKRLNIVETNTPSYKISPQFFINCKRLDNGYSYGNLEFYKFK